jgi:hypothetical protein
MADERSRSLLPPRQQTQESPITASCKYVSNAQLNILTLRRALKYYERAAV